MASPDAVTSIGDPRVVWLSFVAVSQAIDDLLSDPLELVSEQTRFLLRELQGLFAEDGLLDPQSDVVIVAARNAYGVYLTHSAYACQPGRSFRVGLSHMAFYKDGAIQREVPCILAHRDNVNLTRATAENLVASPEEDNQRIGHLAMRLLEAGVRLEGTLCQLFLLSAPTDPRTLLLAAPIRNTKVGASGKFVAFVQGQRYTRTDVLARNPATTDELEASGG